ncbi:MAG TPA: type II secretion system protein [Chthoniobacteraceae bacterium]|nr:type II secretion system protein [Chthoniobacteraceae bacterium]
MKQHHRRFGFTLVELLVAIVLVAALAVFLMAAVSRARKGNRQALDLVSLRQIGTILHGYISDHQQELPVIVTPAPFKTLSIYLGYIPHARDWSNDQSSPKNSIFSPGADQRAIRALFTSAYDERVVPDPLNGFCTNGYIGSNPQTKLGPDDDDPNIRYYYQIRRPSSKIYALPSFFLKSIGERFTAAPSNSPFRSDKNPEEKGHFPALFMDGHAAMVDPAPKGMSANAVHDRWVRPKKE